MQYNLQELSAETQKFRNAEKFQSFQDLLKEAVEGEDFIRNIQSRNSELAIVAPHGGNLEAGSELVAKAIAGDRHSLYTFESLRDTGDDSLHITSTRFDDPSCEKIIRKAKSVITCHGCLWENEIDEIVFIGGRNKDGRDELVQSLRNLDIRANPDELHRGIHQENLCNRGISGEGLQLEFTPGFLNSLLATSETELETPKKLSNLVDIVQSIATRYS